MRRTRFALFQSMIALLLCFSMLVGTTFAWFTDGVSSGTNTIAAGVLDVEMEYLDAAGTWQKVTENTEVLNKNALWEPGYTEVAYLKVSNLGNLALKYGLGVQVNSETGSVNVAGEPFNLSDHIRVGLITSEKHQPFADRIQARNALTDSKLIKEGYGGTGTLYPKNSGEENLSETYVTMVVYMPEEVGNTANYGAGQAIPQIQLGIQLVASQADYESDAFGTGYDTAADLPGFNFPENNIGGSASADVTKDDENKVAQDLTISGSNTNAEIPAGVQLADGAEKLTLTVSPKTDSEANISLGKNDEMRSLDVHVEGVSENNTVPMEIYIKEAAPKGLNAGNLKLYHVENGTTVEMTLVDEFTAHNQFKYDPATGDITLYMATFSEVALVADKVNAWNGDIASGFSGGSGTGSDPYLIANADQLAYLNELVSSKNEAYSAASYKLLSDIEFVGNTEDESKVWYPIGYHAKGSGANKAGESEWYTYGGAFSGVFDGAGHKVSNIYQNTWVMDGKYDNGYWNEAMGLFGYVYNGTVKNLTIDNFYSEGEFAPTGCVTAYAAGNATFENIAITNSKPKTYNTGVAGIVGWDEGDDSIFNFRNITIDSTNTISALWGSWDVAAAGLLGYLGKESKANLTNCNVSATIDVYNDVCGNYQYYWYRYCGMLIGTVDKTDADGNLDLSNITAQNCTVDFGDRHEYYYCEFVDNSIASYTHDYQFSRIEHKDLKFTDANGNGRVDVAEVSSVEGCRHDHEAKGYDEGTEVWKEDKRAVHIPFRQIFGGYGWGVKGTELGENLADNIRDITKKDEPNKKAQVKFETKFTGDFLYRVGNKNEITIGNLFAEKAGASINDSGVYVRIDKVYEDANVTCEFIANATDWTKGTLKFEGTGVVDIVIQDYDYCTPTTLHLEVIDAYNASPDNNIRDAKDYDVVLVGHISSSGFTVSNGHTFYGNGFKATCSGKGTYLNVGGMYRGYINVESGGILDNVRVLCDIYPAALLYSSEAKDYKDEVASEPDRTRNMYQLSAIAIAGNGSKIVNSYAYGGRNNIYVGDGNVTITNTTAENGVLSNIQIKSSDASTVTLNDVTTIQNEVKSTYDNTKTMLGCGILVGDVTSVSNPNLIIQSAWNHYNWVTEANASNTSNSYAKEIINKALSMSDYVHESGNTKKVNLGIIFLNGLPANVNDQRSVKDNYKLSDVTMSLKDPDTGLTGNINGQVYSVANGKGSPDDSAPDYKPETNLGVKPTATKDETIGGNYDSNDGGDDTRGCYWEGDVLKLMYKEYESAFALDVANLVAFKKHGYALESDVTVTKNGTAVVVNDGKVTFSDAGTYVITYTVTDPYNYDKDGKLLAEAIKWPFTYNVEVSVVKSNGKNAEIVVNGSSFYGSYGKAGSSWDPDFHYCIPFMNDVTITDYAEDGTTGTTFEATSNISSIDISGDKSSGTVTLTYSDGRVLVIVVSGHSVGLGSSGNTISVKSYDDKLWICTDGVSNNATTGTWKVTSYKFTGNNGVTVEYTGERTCNFDSGNKNNSPQPNWSSFTNPLDSGSGDDAGDSGDDGGCVTPDTLITLANGKQVRVDSLTGTEELLVWNLETGKYDTAPIVFVDTEEEMEYEVIHLYFSDGSDVKVISEHGFFDLDLGKYVYIDAANYAEYVGHQFVTEGNVTANKWNIVTLDKVELEKEVTTAWSPVTSQHLCYYTNGVLSMPGGIEGLFNIFEVNTDTMRYDAKQKQQDIETYGLLTLEDFGGMITEEAFQAFNGAYLKVAMGKGLLTWEDIAYMAERYIPLM